MRGDIHPMQTTGKHKDWESEISAVQRNTSKDDFENLLSAMNRPC
jgi:hypothetical protein